MKLRRKREMTIQWRPVEPQPDTATEPQHMEEKLKLTERTVKLATKTVLLGAACVYGYVLLDTVRQVSIEATKNQNRHE